MISVGHLDQILDSESRKNQGTRRNALIWIQDPGKIKVRIQIQLAL